ncbi:MAG: DUF1269 domain-containing protein [Fimbriimonadaceae bacterium]|nr:DUF1269 domain-containing protein [Fimbriimonadaceae bacterium]QYK57846.1 MAG: DUF1269 domain-containing protein [Fimbriimonadaceae bacterium]
MNKTLVAIFDTEDAAFTGLTALKDLHHNGDITLFDSAVIKKDNNGQTGVVKAPEGAPTGTFLGMFVGVLAGLVGGPVGVAVGAASGTLVGATVDLLRDNVDYGFVEQVKESLAPGKVAIIADVEETWVTPVDFVVAERGGIVLRRLRHEVVEDQLAREQSEFEAELKELKKDLATATDEAKAKIQSRIDSVERSMTEIRAQAEAQAKKIAAEWNAKREAMELQLRSANMRNRARIKDQMEKSKQEYEVRSAKIKQASSLIAEALRP